MRRRASAAAAVRKVTSAHGRPPSVSALASGAAAAGSSITITGTILSRASSSASRALAAVIGSFAKASYVSHYDLHRGDRSAISTGDPEQRAEDAFDTGARD